MKTITQQLILVPKFIGTFLQKIFSILNYFIFLFAIFFLLPPEIIADPPGFASNLSITPANGSGPINTLQCWTITATDNLSAPVNGAQITVQLFGTHNLSATITTAGMGTAMLCFQANTSGMDSIVATSGNVGDTAVFIWADPCIGVDSSDGDPCTIDACNHSTGAITHTPSGLIVHPFQISPILCYGGAACVDITAQGGVPPYIGTGINCNFPSGTTALTISDANGCSALATITIFEPDKLTLTPSSTPTPCGLALGTVSVLVQFGTPGYSIVWKDSLNNQVGTGSPIGNLPGGTYTAFVTDANGCTASTSATVAVQGIVPQIPSPITGAIGVCKGQSGVVFCVQQDPIASCYIWTLPNGATGSSTSNCITVGFSSKYTGGMICVKAVNNCGAGLPRCESIPVILTKPLKPGVISGAPDVCAGSVYNYCVPAVSGLTYNWSIGGNNHVTLLGSQGGPCVQVNVPANATGNFDIKVRALNCKGLSDERKTTVNIQNIPSMPSTISGPSSACEISVGTYSVNNVNGVTYNWSVTGGPIVVSGQGTNMVAIDFILSVANMGVVSVTASNSCGISPARNKTVSINPNCRISFAETGDETEPGLIIYPNPAHDFINIDFNSSTDGNSFIAIYDLTGRIVKQLFFTMVNGENHELINLSETSKGTYMLRIVTPEGLLIKKVLVE